MKEQILKWLEEVKKAGIDMSHYELVGDARMFSLYYKISSELCDVIELYDEEGYNPRHLGSKFLKLIRNSDYDVEFKKAPKGFHVIHFIKRV